MIAYFPEIYKDELVYSWFSRYASKSPYQQYISVAEELYKNPLVRPDFDFINELCGTILKSCDSIRKGMGPTCAKRQQLSTGAKIDWTLDDLNLSDI